MWERASGVALIGLGVMWVQGQQCTAWGSSIGLGTVGPSVGEAWGEPRVEVEQDDRGVYHVRLSGRFEMQVDGTVEFYKRMLVIFLGLLDVPGETRRSRRTRDGRTPFVREEQMAEWFGVAHPAMISIARSAAPTIVNRLFILPPPLGHVHIGG